MDKPKVPFGPDAVSGMIEDFVNISKMGRELIVETSAVDAVRSMGRGAGGDITTYLDKKLEELVIDYCRREGNVRMISEEAGIMDFGEPHWQLVADPLDGSKNAGLGIPVFCISLAAMPLNGTVGETAVGFVGDLTHDDYFYAIAGGGAFNRKEKIGAVTKKFHRVPKQFGPIGVELSPVPYKALTRSMPVIERTETVRDLGTIALDMCYVAYGAFDAVLDLRGLLRRLDILAGKLIVEESGGCVSQPDGTSLDDEVFTLDGRGDIVAASSADAMEKILELL